MAQYDVYPNPSRHSEQHMPYVVVIQSDLIDALATRLTVPLAVLDFSGQVPNTLCPAVTVNGQRFRAWAHFAAPLPAKLLKNPVCNVSNQASSLVAAMDVVLSGI
jgi:toxin CcdB